MSTRTKGLLAASSSVLLLVLGQAALAENWGTATPAVIATWTISGFGLVMIVSLSLTGVMHSLGEADVILAAAIYERDRLPVDAQAQHLLFARKILAFCQRSATPLSVIGVDWSGVVGRVQDGGPDTGDSVRRHLIRFRHLKALDEQLRQSDGIVTLGSSERCYVVCPGTDTAAAQGAAARIKAVLAPLTPAGAEIRVATASYGDDGYALEELFDNCGRQLATPRFRIFRGSQAGPRTARLPGSTMTGRAAPDGSVR